MRSSAPSCFCPPFSFGPIEPQAPGVGDIPDHAQFPLASRVPAKSLVRGRENLQTLCPSDGLCLRRCCSVRKPQRVASADSARTVHASENSRSPDKSHSPASLLLAKLSSLEMMMTWTPPETTLVSTGPLYQGYLNMSCVMHVVSACRLESGFKPTTEDRRPKTRRGRTP